MRVRGWGSAKDVILKGIVASDEWLVARADREGVNAQNVSGQGPGTEDTQFTKTG
jgi:hypothetical protein